MTKTEVFDDPFAPIAKLTAEARAVADTVGRNEARGLVDLYYRIQEHRIALAGQSRALRADERPHQISDHFASQMRALETQMRTILDGYSTSSEVGRWSRDQHGIGPVIAAGLMAHIDIEKAPTVGHIWRFAGLDPTVEWGKGQKRPWNADLKVLCWKTGDSFVKLSGNPKCYYGLLYRQRKGYEITRDENGGNAAAAAETLEKRKIRDKATKEIYESGHLPPGRLDLRARRWAVKLFLSHWHHVAYEEHYGTPPPNPYPIAHLGHVHYLEVPEGGDRVA